jgi:hypothetical protein
VGGIKQVWQEFPDAGSMAAFAEVVAARAADVADLGPAAQGTGERASFLQIGEPLTADAALLGICCLIVAHDLSTSVCLRRQL